MSKRVCGETGMAAAAAVVGTLSVLCQSVSAQTTAEEEYNYTTVPTTFTRGGDDNITYHDDGSSLEAARFGNTTMIVGLTMAGVLLMVTLVGLITIARKYLTDAARHTFRSYYYDSLTETYHLQRDASEVEMLYFDHPGVVRPTYGSAPTDWARPEQCSWESNL
eukprot:m.191086 g.191086  ORF g.191086 m.191086 type:complete len:164 (+) comp24908_c2_seq1:129-620(+)